MSQSKMRQVTTYIAPVDMPKIVKKRGEKGFISDSAYLRSLVLTDIKKKN